MLRLLWLPLSLVCATLAAADPFPPELNPPLKDIAPFEYEDVGRKIPNYTPGKKWGVQGELKTHMQRPLAAAESLKHLIVPKHFHAELFVAEPQLGGKPLAMAWDERGRLWVAETYDYPNELQPPEKGRDRIRICEDTDGDFRADKFTVFAEQLSIPTSLAFSQGGLIVFEGTRTLFLKDTTGDDVADERRVLFSGWALNDTHGGPSNMQYGLDNWIWAMQGYNNSKLEVGGQTHQFRQGFFRFQPDASRLEFIRSTDNNTYGLGISEAGLIFGSTANHNPSVFMPIANRYYEGVRGWAPSLTLGTIADTHLFRAITENVRQVDHFGGYTAGAGHSLYTARRYPREYWNRTAFVCEPTGHLVGTFVLSPDGAGYRSTSPFNLLASDDEWTAPIVAEVGPDGNVWIIDWYNYIVQHNPTPIGFKTGKGAAYESELRDKRHGRIYRVVYDGPEGEPAEKSFTLADASPEKLVATLSNNNLFWRRHAQRLLVERANRDVLPALVKLVENQQVDAIGLNVGAIHALWTLQGLGAMDAASHDSQTAVAVAALKHPSAAVRRNAAQVLPATGQSARAIVSAGLLDDADAQVQLAALLALADAPSTPGIGPMLAVKLARSDLSKDRWLLEALTAAAARNSDDFLIGLNLFRPDSESAALQAKIVETARIVAEHRARTGPYDKPGILIAAVSSMPPPVAEAIVEGLARGWPADKPPQLDPATEALLEILAPRLSLAGRGTLVQLARRWGSERFRRYAAELATALDEQIRDEQLPVEKRIAAARERITLEPDRADAADALLQLITPRVSPEFATGLLTAAAQSQADGAGKLLADRLPTMTPGNRKAGLAALLTRGAWTLALLDSLEQGQLSVSDLSLTEKRALAEHPDGRIKRRAEKLLVNGGGLPNADRRQVLAELLPVTKQTGDVARGKAVFLKQCAKCHVHGGEGTRIGPDLTGVAVHPKEELLDNILDPSRSVEGNFRIYTLATDSGQVITGLLSSESKTAVELIDVEGKKHSILREEIEELSGSQKSLMPEGFEKQVSRAELVDLLEFLAHRGKYLPLALDKVASVVSTRGMFVDPNSTAERLVFDDWSPKTLAGVPFQLVDPQGDRVANAVLLYSPQGMCRSMPKSVSLPCRAPAKAVHLLGGISGWGHPLGTKGSVSLIVRLHYAGSEGVAGTSEDHPLANGEHLSDYMRRVDVPGSQYAFDLHGRQLRYLSVIPQRSDPIESIELVKGPDDTAPVVMAVTVEPP